MLHRSKHRSNKPKYKVYQPQLLESDLRTHPIEVQPSQIRLSATYTADLLVIILLCVLTICMIFIAYPHSAYQTSQDVGLTSKSSLVRTIHKVAFLHTPIARTLLTNKTADKTESTNNSCNDHTLINIVAHEDDDLLFMNPHLAKAIQKHDCIRTVYVTAGDDGRGTDYLHLREAGSEAAYNTMLGSNKPWVYKQLKVSSDFTLITASPNNNPNITLIFLRLPDGNLDGSGFEATRFESLKSLRADTIQSITSVDGTTTYTNDQLTQVLTELMERYHPIEINTQANDFDLNDVADHSDHIATGQYASEAATFYAGIEKKDVSHLIHYYVGYPIRQMTVNVSTTDQMIKSTAFFAYAADDPGVCTSLGMCEETSSSYAMYLSRMYTLDH